MSLFGEVAGQRFFLGTQYRWDPIIARTWAGFYPRGLVSSSPEVVAAAATREFAPLVLLDTFNRAAGKCLVPFERKYSNTGVCGIAEAVVHELLRVHPGWIVAVCEFDAVVLLCTVVRDKLRGLHVCSFGSPLENSTCRDLILSKLYQWLD